MNGKPPAPPAPPQIPPSVQQARQHPPRPGRRGWTGLWRARIVWALVGLAVVAMIVAKVVATMQTKTPTTAATQSTMDPHWGRQTFQYKTAEPVLPTEPKAPEDTITPRLDALLREQAALRAEFELLKNRKTTTTGAKQRAAGSPTSRACPHAVYFAYSAKRGRGGEGGYTNLCPGAWNLPALRG